MRQVAWLWVCGALCIAAGQAAAQSQPGASPVTSSAHHARTRHHRHAARPVTPPAPVPAQPQASAATPGTAPAPMPNPDIGPPHQSTDATTVDPGSPQLHYPTLGNGFLPGSSAQSLENLRSSQIPGATVHVPVQEPPQPLPPPGTGGQ